MSNLDILQEIKKNYNPNTAFGNNNLIKLLDSIIEPNEEGFFEVEAEPRIIKRVSWHCVDCGCYHEEDIERPEEMSLSIIRNCQSCRSSHLIQTNL